MIKGMGVQIKELQNAVDFLGKCETDLDIENEITWLEIIIQDLKRFKLSRQSIAQKVSTRIIK